ncbi:MAG TPA: hypothetical protein VK657_08635 [Terriglobales bacterium]|nr:hypothetical protein [Terriglobales bacterium]
MPICDRHIAAQFARRHSAGVGARAAPGLLQHPSSMLVMFLSQAVIGSGVFRGIESLVERVIAAVSLRLGLYTPRLPR